MKLFKRVLLAVLLVILLFQGIIALGWMLAPKGEAEYVLVLGAQIYETEPSPLLAERIASAERYLLEHPSSRAVLCGGVGEGERVSEAEVMANVLLRAGIARERLLLEEGSVNTWTNLKYAAALIERESGARPESLMVATSDYHVLRVRFLGARLGIRIYPLPAKTPLSAVPRDYTREMLAILKSLLVDRE